MDSENPYRAPPDSVAALDKTSPLSPKQIAASRRTPWLISLVGAAASVYGPYAVMTIYTHFYVSCDHCKKATRDLLPCAPALLPVELAQRFLGIGRQDDWIWFSVSFAVAMMWVIGLALLLRRSKLLGAIAAALTLSLGSFLATALLAMIRM